MACTTLSYRKADTRLPGLSNDLSYNFRMKKLYNIVDRKILLRKMQESPEERITLSFYKYVHLFNPAFFRDHLYTMFDDLHVLGRIYVAHEGINAQISVPVEMMELFRNALQEVDFFKGMRLNYAIEDSGKSFFKLAIKVRSKIVADGLDDKSFDVTNSGIHLNAQSFNELASNPQAVIVDMRNHYESEVGRFENAICPDASTFREALPEVVDTLKDKKCHPVIMYCTGGIRCEKASAYLKHCGFEEVYQLNGGIIEYARQVKELNLENKFKGVNFVFDERLGEAISSEIISKCHQCGQPAARHVNCANDQCHLLFIQCDSCATDMKNCCSEKCADFITKSPEEQERTKGSTLFNGSKFSKGRYRLDSNAELSSQSRLTDQQST